MWRFGQGDGVEREGGYYDKAFGHTLEISEAELVMKQNLTHLFESEVRFGSSNNERNYRASIGIVAEISELPAVASTSHIFITMFYVV